MSDRKTLTRRTLLKIAGGAGAGLVLGCYAVPKTIEGAKGAKEPAAGTFAPNVWLSIDPQGFVTVSISKSEMGQGVRTALAMIVAEELDIDWQKVKVTQAPADKQYGNQGTGGSGSIRSMYAPLRKAGATAKHMLVAAAAKEWGTDVGACSTGGGQVKNNSKSMSYGDLAVLAAGMPMPEDAAVKLKEPKDYKIIGKATKRIDNLDVVTGKAKYGLDAHIDGAKIAVVSRAPAFGAKVKSFDDSACKAVPGYIKSVQIGTGVAAIGENTWAALQAVNALKVDWDMGPNSDLDSDKIRKSLLAVVLEPPVTGGTVVKAGYDLPHIAHATMEPMNCVADVKADSCVVYAPCQTPNSAQSGVARALGIAPEKVTINVTLLGGGFGRRLNPDFVMEAVAISKAAALPVKLMWTRADDMKHDNYRTASHHALVGAVQDGKAVAWEHQFISAEGGDGKGNRGRAGIPYQIENAGQYAQDVLCPVPTGAWRSVDNTQLGFANESFIDELAHAAGKDPFEFRKAHLPDGRLKNCLVLAAEKAGWGSPMPKGKGRGIACFAGYGSFCAHIAEVTVGSDGQVKVDRMVVAYDCGQVINPSGADAQIEGAASDGLATALKAEITIKSGAVEQSHWGDYEWLLIDEMPKMEIHRVESTEGPGGMGEVGYPSVAPAVANAVFAATGKRVRKLPIRAKDLA